MPTLEDEINKIIQADEIACLQRASKEVLRKMARSPSPDFSPSGIEGIMVSDLNLIKQLTHQSVITEVLGFWRGFAIEDPEDRYYMLPWPQEHVDTTWDPKEARIVGGYLNQSPVVQRWRGNSSCRICGILNGFTDRSDGRYLWPEGLAHYVADHLVKPPPDVLQYFLSKVSQ